MGMYTGIRFKGYVKPEFRKGFEIIAIHGEWEKHPDPILQAFSKIERSFLIPAGALDGMPEEWSNTKEFERFYDEKTGYWVFQCSLKDYDDTFEKWFEIVPYFIERIEYLELYSEAFEEYEDSDVCSSVRYGLANGTVEVIDEKFRDYEC